MRVVLMFILATSLSQYSQAADLGRYGTTHKITEDDFEHHIIKSLEALGEEKLQKHQEMIQKKIIENIKRPKPVAGITKATEDNLRYHRPEYIVPDDIYDAENNLIHAKGTTIYPLEIKDFDEIWIMIDGDNEKHRKFAKEYNFENRPKKIILVNGSPGEQSNGDFYYYDQYGEITKKLKITKVPTVIRQAKDKKIIEIEEVFLK